MSKTATPSSYIKNTLLFLKAYRIVNKLAYGLSIAAILSVIATYLSLTGGGGRSTQNILPFLYLNLTLLLMLSVVIAKRFVELWVERKRGQAGSKLHVHLVVLFGFVSVTPAILVVIFSALFFNVGIQSWFGKPVKTAIEEADRVAEAYLSVHNETIVRDAQAIVMEMRPYIPVLVQQKKLFSDILTEEANARGLTEVLIFNGNQDVVARSHLTFVLEFEKILESVFERVRAGEVVAIANETGDRVRALVRLDPITDTYLYIGKKVDAEVLQHLARTKGAISEYKRLEAEGSGLQITFILFFSVISLLLLLAAIWVGLTLANRLVRPIGRLITAAEAVSEGQLNIQVREDQDEKTELGNLIHSFNHMTRRLYQQHQALTQANAQLDNRRQFTEAVLAGVSAGVLGLDATRLIHLPNQRAADLLSIKLEDIQGQPLETILPEAIPFLEGALKTPEHPWNRQITITRRGYTRIFQLCIVVERTHKQHTGFILTFDDVTPLLSAQRKAAWSDVARKIAHEIKNPLTPIQLSAERLKRRYLSQITTGQETFQNCIDTIIRQVGQIGKLVTEFSAFARMPEPNMKTENLAEICQHAFLLQKESRREIDLRILLPKDSIPWICDGQQISQALTNLLQNSVDSVTNYYRLEDPERKKTVSKKAKVLLSLTVDERNMTIKVEDNGPGFPKEGRERLTEPYYTTRSKGTGLGLAIVSKIVHDHKGALYFENSTLGGAKVVLNFPKRGALLPPKDPSKKEESSVPKTLKKKKKS